MAVFFLNTQSSKPVPKILFNTFLHFMYERLVVYNYNYKSNFLQPSLTPYFMVQIVDEIKTSMYCMYSRSWLCKVRIV